jgi:KRAB domain-containing zinc finger protein
MQFGAEIKAFKCEICDYKNGQKSVLKKHIESVHKGIKKFECNICDYKASRNSSLKRHIASVHYGSTGC